ncbi:MAG TPA: hypothetical protein VK586_23425 [Streptosporangiaceae bacterium]|nr:hypothetical protein [Streptosporangiaceae bacterium]
MRRADYAKRTAVYRAFDAAAVLLYVGMTHQPRTRFAQHREKFHWWRDVADVSVEWHEDRWGAEAVEGAAILAEKPRYNEATYYARRYWITSWQEFPRDLAVEAVPAPTHVALALGARPGVLAVRHRSCRERDGEVTGLSTAWAIPQAWKWDNSTEFIRPRLRPASADELASLSAGRGVSVTRRAKVFSYSPRPWFIEDVSVDGFDLAWSMVTAAPAGEA